jgi:hypothetical protein
MLAFLIDIQLRFLHSYYPGHIIVYFPPLEKGGGGDLKAGKIPLNPPLQRGILKRFRINAERKS